MFNFGQKFAGESEFANKEKIIWYYYVHVLQLNWVAALETSGLVHTCAHAHRAVILLKEMPVCNQQHEFNVSWRSILVSNFFFRCVLFTVRRFIIKFVIEISLLGGHGELSRYLTDGVTSIDFHSYQMSSSGSKSWFEVDKPRVQFSSRRSVILVRFSWFFSSTSRQVPDSVSD
jgi:hypothetical protein